MSGGNAAPEGWTVATIMDISTSSGGGTPSKADPSYWSRGDLPWVSPKDMKSFFVTSSEDLVTAKALERLTLVPEHSILVVVRSGILSRTLPVSINTIPVTINQDMRAFVPSSGIEPRFVAWQLISNERAILDKCSKDGTTVASIEGPALASYPFFVAPAAEQTRIVEKLEELLSDLDAGVAELKAAQKKLAQYRQSLLKAAVEGRLTAVWRARHGDCGESGAELLARILRERRARWEAKQLAKFEAQGKAPPQGWRDKYPEPVVVETKGLPELPNGWIWAKAEQLCDFITKGTTPPKALHAEGDKTVPFLRVTNLSDDGTLDLEDKVFVSEQTHRGFLGRSIVFPGDILMNIVGPPLGQVSAVPTTFAEWNVNQAIAIFRAVAGVAPQFVCLYLLSVSAQHWLKARAKTTAGQTNLTLEVCRGLPFPLPPEQEQSEIAQQAEAAVTRLGEQESAINHALRQSAAQRQNILRAAFSGQLVLQDPADEPASVLLARIRAERAAQGTVKTRRGREAKETA